MTEQELTNHQLQFAKDMARLLVPSPCMSVVSNETGVELKSKCILFDIYNGCRKKEGYLMEPGKPVRCPDGKGNIEFQSEKITEELKQAAYSMDLASLEISTRLPESAEESTILFT